MQVHDMSRSRIIVRWNFKWLLIAKLLLIFGDVRVDFFPPGVYLRFCKTNTRNIPEAQIDATLKLGKSAPVWQRKFCGCCSNFVFNYIGVAYFNLVGRISSKSWKIHQCCSYFLSKTQQTELYIIIFMPNFSDVLWLGGGLQPNHIAAFPGQYLHSLTRLKLLQLTPSQIRGLAVLHWLLVPPTRALKKHQKCWEWTICLCIYDIYIYMYVYIYKELHPSPNRVLVKYLALTGTVFVYLLSGDIEALWFAGLQTLQM